MSTYLKKYNHVKIIENNEKVLLVNVNNHNSIIINKEVYEIINNLEDIEDINGIIGDYNNEDKLFLLHLKKILDDSGILENALISSELCIHYIITDNCNLRCSHCCYSAYTLHNNIYKKTNISLEILKRIIELRPNEINITGGEPLIVRNFNEVIELLENSGIARIGLSTNATLINNNNVKRLVKCFDTFNISIDGINEEKCDKIRGTGTFRKVISAIKLLQEHNVRNIMLSAAFDLDTKDDIGYFNELCLNLNVIPITRKMSSVGRARDNMFHCEEQNKDYFNNLKFQLCSCFAGINEISVNSNGDVFPCINFNSDEFKMGSIFDVNILDKMRHDDEYEWYKNFSNFVATNREECKDCELNVFCWGCPLFIKNFMEIHGISKLKSICKAKYNEMWRTIWNV